MRLHIQHTSEREVGKNIAFMLIDVMHSMDMFMYSQLENPIASSLDEKKNRTGSM